MENPIYSSSVPETLTFYRGGLNIGVFYPGPPVYPSGSEVFGNEFTGNPYIYKTQAIDSGEKSFGWIIIISPEDSNIVIRNKSENKNKESFSSYDGMHNRNKLNTVGKSIISSYRKNSYKDWYVPSRDELAFICKNLPQNFLFDYRYKQMGNKRYLSSTYVKNQSGKEDFLYAQSFMSDTYGTTSVIRDTVSMPVRYIRRVPVYII